MFLIFYLIFLGVPFLLNYRKHGFNGSTFLLFIYFSGAISSLYVVVFTTMFDVDRLDFFAIIYHILCLYLLFYPVVEFGNRIKFIRFQPSTLKLFSYAVIITSLTSILLYAPDVIKVLKMGVSEARVAFYMGTLKTNEGGLVEYLKLPGKGFSLVAPFLLFYFLSRYPSKKHIIFLFFISSLVDVFYTLTNGGRGGLVRWSLMMTFFYLTFKDVIGFKVKKYISTLIIILGAVIGFIFSITTIGRFSGREFTVFDYVASYAGQSYLYFSYQFYDFFEVTSYGKQVFKIFSTDEKDLNRFNEVVGQLSYNTNVFSTLVGSFYKDLGFYFTLMLCFFNYAIYFFIVKLNVFRKLKLFILMYFTILLAIVLNGYFYYQYSSAADTKVFLLAIALSILLPMFEKLIFRLQNSKV